LKKPGVKGLSSREFSPGDTGSPLDLNLAIRLESDAWWIRPGSGEFTRVFGMVPEVGDKPSPETDRERRRCLVRRSSSSLRRPGRRPGNGMSLGSLYFAIDAENGGTGDNPPRGGGTGLDSDSNEAPDADECVCPCEICDVGLAFIALKSVFPLAPLSLLMEVSGFSSFRDRAKLLDLDRRPVSVVLTLSHLDDVLPLSRFFLEGDRSKRRDDSRSVRPSRSVWTSSKSVKKSE
jgi:hypothetical protein